MRRFIVFLLVLSLSAASLPVSAFAEVERHILLDEAFVMLEKDNIFLRRYNEITGAEVEGLFALGVPYFFGGGKNEWFLASYPEYRQLNSWQDGGGYYIDKLYLVGLDCAGFLNYVFDDAGYKKFSSLTDIIALDEYKVNHVYSYKEGMNIPGDWEELARNLQVGDVLVAFHPYRHGMMYIGTLADYGFTAEEEPALAPYLNYPLIIHAASNPQLQKRFINLIETNRRYEHCTPPAGGVAVSILGVPLEAGEFLGNVGSERYYGFYLDEDDKLELTIWDFNRVDVYAWWRNVR